MSDTLKEMEHKLQTYNVEYKKYEKYYESEESKGGKKVTSLEKSI